MSPEWIAFWGIVISAVIAAAVTIVGFLLGRANIQSDITAKYMDMLNDATDDLKKAREELEKERKARKDDRRARESLEKRVLILENVNEENARLKTEVAQLTERVTALEGERDRLAELLADKGEE